MSNGITQDILNDPKRLQEYYEEKFKDNPFIKDNYRKEWKQQNVANITSKKCGLIYGTWTSTNGAMAGYKAIDGLGSEAPPIPPNNFGRRRGEPAAKSWADYFSGEIRVQSQKNRELLNLEAREPGRNAVKRVINDELYAPKAQNLIFESACGKNLKDLEVLLDYKFNEEKKKSLGSTLQGDVDSIGAQSKKETLACARRLAEYRTSLEQALNLFWTSAKRPDVGLFNDYDSDQLRGMVPSPPARVKPAAPTLNKAQVASESVFGAGEVADAVADEEISSTPSFVNPQDNPLFIPQVTDPQAMFKDAIGDAVSVEIASSLPSWVVFSPTGIPTTNGAPLASAPTSYKFRWDFLLIDQNARNSLKNPEWYKDLAASPSVKTVSMMPTLFASLCVGIHNAIEYVLLPALPNAAQVDAYQGGADGSDIQLYNQAQSILRAMDGGDQNAFPLQPPIGEDESYDSVINYAQESIGKLDNSQIKTWLGRDSLTTLKNFLNAIKEDAKCIKKEKDELDKNLDNIKEAVPEAAKEVLNEDDAKDVATDSAAVIDSFDIDNIGFTSPTDKKLFKEQCFLLAFAAKIASYKNNTLDYSIGTTPAHPAGVHKRLPYENLSQFGIRQTEFAAKKDFNASIQMSGDPFGFINKLTQSPNYSDLLDIGHDQLSSLQPKIRLFKVVYNDNQLNRSGQFINSEKEREIEIAFNSVFSKSELDEIYIGSKARSAGIGLKSFEFTYDGNNPFSYKKSIKAKLVLHAASFQEFFVPRTGKFRDYEGSELLLGGKESYRYIDLALKTFTTFNKLNTVSAQYAKLRDQNSNLAKLNFRLKAVVGWSVPPGNIPGIDPEQKKRLVRAISNSFVTLNLTPTIHNFNFEQDGSVTLEIDYLAYIDDFFDDRGFNVFADPSGVVGWQRELRKLKMKRLRSACKSAEGIQELNEKYKDTVQKEINDSLSSLISSLINNNKIYYINLNYAKIQDFIASGPYQNYENYVIKNARGDIIVSDDEKDEIVAKQINSALESYKAQREEYNNAGGSAEEPPNLGAALYAASPQSNELSFFYLGDLIDIVLENIQKEQAVLISQFESEQNKEQFTFPKKSAIANLGLTNALKSEGEDGNKDKISIVDWNERRIELEKFARNLKRMRILLGPVELVHHKKQAEGNISEFVNFGDVPISVKYFMEWISGKVLSKDEVFYALPVFITQLMNNLVSKFLNNNNCFFFDIKQKVRVNQCSLTTFSPPEYGGKDELTNLLVSPIIASKAKLMKKFNRAGSPTRLNLSDSSVLHHRGLNADGTIANPNLLRPILNVSGRANEENINYPILNNEINYMVFFAGQVSKPSEYPVDKEENRRNGIFHYLLGRDRGLIKEINLQKTTSKGLAEVRFEQDGYDGLKQLRVIYDLDVTTYANVNTFPGTYIYVPAAGFDPAMSTNLITTTDGDGNLMPLRMEELGIGGYYMIIRSTHKFGIGEATTEISAKWIAGLASDYPIAEGENSDPSEVGCAEAINTRKEKMSSS